ncbi:Patatin-like phospholipase [Roseivivax jejudonensis]|uniref:Patatin-like phospholipase n=1 Tax=Roseivivax jejudonensis TaxID=1529041 RepID=A0A1X7A668_9RHOB|nr:patatin-like phospholipase family protein [Roseivivax jejudonensis]SLN71674.1 Patatin-like phospholipase [Roseivivax jejudonensis]
MTTTPKTKKPILVALQGGGSHGAMGWGVLDRLLEEPDLDIVAVSGTSAGAMNAAFLSAGLAAGGAEAARAALARYWRSVSRSAAFSPIQRTPLARMLGDWSFDDNPGYRMLDLMSRMVSPYQSSLPGHHPLAPILERHLDLEALNAAAAPRTYITATNVRTGLPRVFTQPELSVETLLASAALPNLFRAVEIDGEAYWDGGYVGNPALFPLIALESAHDLVIVQTNPFRRPDIPRTARDIANRLNEITFNSSLLKELRALIAAQARGRETDVRLHNVQADDVLIEYSPSSKLNAEWAYLQHLFERGRAETDRFLEAHGQDIGVRSSFDPRPMIQDLMSENIDLAQEVE